jgi:hypothetical protein
MPSWTPNDVDIFIPSRAANAVGGVEGRAGHALDAAIDHVTELFREMARGHKPSNDPCLVQVVHNDTAPNPNCYMYSGIHVGRAARWTYDSKTLANVLAETRECLQTFGRACLLDVAYDMSADGATSLVRVMEEDLARRVAKSGGSSVEMGTAPQYVLNCARVYCQARGGCRGVSWARGVPNVNIVQVCGDAADVDTVRRMFDLKNVAVDVRYSHERREFDFNVDKDAAEAIAAHDLVLQCWDKPLTVDPEKMRSGTDAAPLASREGPFGWIQVQMERMDKYMHRGFGVKPAP